MQIWLKLTVPSEEGLWLHAHDQIFGTLKAGASRLWKMPAETAQMRRKTTDAAIIKLASAAANRFAHLTDFMYERRTTKINYGR